MEMVKNVRDWLYVLDHCHAIDVVFNSGKAGETYVIGGNNEHTNLFIANKICAILDSLRPKPNGSYKDQLTFVADRPGHDQRYAIDASKIERELNWKPEVDFETGLKNTVEWYLNQAE